MAAHNFPSFAVPFIGRTDELSQVTDRLCDPACRLLTLTGTGGIGKTRLAIEAAQRLVNDDKSPSPTAFSDGCYFVPLQPLTSPDFIVSAIAGALNIVFRGELTPQQQVFNHLKSKHLLLVLDNFEHVMAGVELLPELLENAPRIKLLVTSRERLCLREEWLFDVGGLTFPDEENRIGWDTFTAVQLFLHCAHRVGYTPTETDTESMVRICQIVEGIPLAVELAAAWVRIMPCADIAREVAHSLNILTTTTRNVPEIHRSIRAAFEHSWNLLAEAEQAAFRKLSVFRGGFTREGAEQVAGTTLAILVALVDKSLVQVDATGRYDLHELLRQYAAEKLRDAGEVNAMIQRHIDYFAQLAAGVEAHAFGHEQVVWFDRVETEFDNLRAAFIGSLETETSLRMASALGWFFTERGYWKEGLTWLEGALEANPNAPDTQRAKAHHCAAASSAMGGRNPQLAQAHCEQALALARATNDRWNVAWALSHLGQYGERADQSAAHFDESIALFRELDDRMGLAHTLFRRAFIAQNRRNFAHARRLAEEVGVYARAAGDRVMMAWANFMMGNLFRDQDHVLDLARTHFQTALSLFREAHVQIGVDIILRMLAEIEAMMGNLLQAQRYSQEALRWGWTIWPDSVFLPGNLLALAHIAKTREQYERAAILMGAVHSHWDEIRFRESSIPFDCDQDAVREQLGETAFAQAWSAGQAMTREQTVAYALEREAESGEQFETTDRSAQATDLLTAREVDILSLVADGLTNREIAGELFLSVNTVKWYLKEIYSTLGVVNRTEAVARAHTLGVLLPQ